MGMSPLRSFEFTLAVVGTLATLLALISIPGSFILLLSILVFTVLFGGLLLHRLFETQIATFAEGSALHGSGYIEEFRSAERSLLLMHVDDDAPSPQLAGLYAELLAKGIQIRRLLVGKALGWDQPEHENLQQRVIERGPLPLSFAVVDSKTVLLALPGYGPTETVSLSNRLVLRHLVRLTHPSVTAAFIETYELAWTQAGARTPRKGLDCE